MNKRWVGLAVLMGMLLAQLAWAQSAEDELAALRERFKQRYPQLTQLKSQGQVGESWNGWVEAVQSLERKQDQQLLTQENNDRRRLYEILAEQTRTTPELVAQRNGVRNFEKAHVGEYLKGRDGKWFRKPPPSDS